MNDDLQRNWRLGATLSFPLSARYSVRLYASRGVSARTNNNYDLIGIALQYPLGRRPLTRCALIRSGAAKPPRIGAWIDREAEFVALCVSNDCGLQRWRGKKVPQWQHDRRVVGALSVGLDDPCRTNSTRAAATRYRKPDIA